MGAAVGAVDRRVAPDVAALQLENPADGPQPFREGRELLRRNLSVRLRAGQAGLGEDAVSGVGLDEAGEQKLTEAAIKTSMDNDQPAWQQFRPKKGHDELASDIAKQRDELAADIAKQRVEFDKPRVN